MTVGKFFKLMHCFHVIHVPVFSSDSLDILLCYVLIQVALPCEAFTKLAFDQ